MDFHKQYRDMNENITPSDTNLLFQALAHFSSTLVSTVFEHDKGKCIDLLLIDENIEFYKLRRLISFHLIVKRRISSRT